MDGTQQFRAKKDGLTDNATPSCSGIPFNRTALKFAATSAMSGKFSSLQMTHQLFLGPGWCLRTLCEWSKSGTIPTLFPRQKLCIQIKVREMAQIHTDLSPSFLPSIPNPSAVL
jgi:hypothetical protein